MFKNKRASERETLKLFKLNFRQRIKFKHFIITVIIIIIYEKVNHMKNDTPLQLWLHSSI
jgi:hypothetical protein